MNKTQRLSSVWIGLVAHKLNGKIINMNYDEWEQRTLKWLFVHIKLKYEAINGNFYF